MAVGRGGEGDGLGGAGRGREGEREGVKGGQDTRSRANPSSTTHYQKVINFMEILEANLCPFQFQ